MDLISKCSNAGPPGRAGRCGARPVGGARERRPHGAAVRARGRAALGFRARDERSVDAAPASATLRPGIELPQAATSAAGPRRLGARAEAGDRRAQEGPASPYAVRRTAPPLSGETGRCQVTSLTAPGGCVLAAAPERRGGKGGRRVSCSRSSGLGPVGGAWTLPSQSPARLPAPEEARPGGPRASPPWPSVRLSRPGWSILRPHFVQLLWKSLLFALEIFTS